MKVLNRWQCWVIGLWETLKIGFPVCGCDYIEIENENKIIITLECQRCGKISSGRIV